MSRTPHRLRRLAAAAAAGALALVGQASVATAAPGTGPDVVANRLLSPLSVAVGQDGTVFYSTNFTGTLFSQAPDGDPEQIFQAKKKGQEVGALATAGQNLFFAAGASLKYLDTSTGNTVHPLADLGAYEEAENPDAGVTYGVPGLGKRCVRKWPADELGPPKYRGVVEAHPYATAVTEGSIYVADAAGNTILRVSESGEVSTVAVLPRIGVKITKKRARAWDMPGCAVGETRYLEGVPTDVEVGPGGFLYVTSLPGGPEDLPFGSVLRIHPDTGAVETIHEGLVSAAGVAIAENGDVYATELFGGRVTRIPADGSDAEVWTEAVLPSAIEIDGNTVYVTSNVLSGLGGGRPRGKLLAYGIEAPNP